MKRKLKENKRNGIHIDCRCMIYRILLVISDGRIHIHRQSPIILDYSLPLRLIQIVRLFSITRILFGCNVRCQKLGQKNPCPFCTDEILIDDEMACSQSVRYTKRNETKKKLPAYQSKWTKMD